MEAAAQPGAMPPQAIVMQMAMGLWVSKTIADVSKLGVPDVLKKHGALTAAEMVAKGIGANADALERAMRACATLGIVTETADGHFGPTDLSNVLASDTPGSVKGIVELFCGPAYKMWGRLFEAIQTGKPQAVGALGAEFWDYLQANPQELETFAEAMKSNSHASLVGVLEHCDFSETRKLVDVAGGFGHMVIALLEKYPTLYGVLLDRPELIPVAKDKNPAPASIASRLEYVGGDMFASVPAGADVYIMKHIIHDWDDARCVTLLKNCREAMAPGGRILCVDAVLPPMGDTSNTAGKLMDLNMLTCIPGKERTLEQWTSIYAQAGLRVTGVTPLNDNFGTSVVEGRVA